MNLGRRFLITAAVLILALGLAGCVTLTDFEASQEYRAQVAAATRSNRSIGQTFVARRPGLNSIQLWLRLGSGQPPAGATMTVELLTSPDNGAPLFTTRIPLTVVAGASPTAIVLPPRADPPNTPYYLRLTSPDQVVEALGRSEDAYPFGQVYSGDQPMDADLAFRLTYDYGMSAFIGDLRSAVGNLYLLLPLLAVVVLPGWTFLELSGLIRRFDFAEQIGLAVGLSLSILPIILLWTSSAGMHWSTTGYIIALLLCAGLAVSLAWRRIGFRPRLQLDWISLGLGAVLIASAVLRLIMIRDLSAPAWVDSIHHALLTRLVMQSGSYPSSYAPFIEIASASYHTGYHVALAIFTQLAGLDLLSGMLIYGQALNTLAIFSVYLFTKTLFQHRLAGLIAALTSGLVTLMPAYYTSWGRYTQLAGMLIFPACLTFLLLLAEQPPADSEAPLVKQRTIRLSLLVGAGITFGGVFLVHYRVLGFLILILAAGLVIELFRRIRSQTIWREMWLRGVHYLLAALIALGLTAPWWPSTLQSVISPNLAPVQNTTQPLFVDFTWGYLTVGLGVYMLALAGLGLMWGMFQRKPIAFTLGLWAILLFTAGNLYYFGLPGAGFLTNASIEIMLYLPISALCGYLLGWVVESWGEFVPGRARPIYFLAILAVGVWVGWLGFRSLMVTINPVTILFRQSDRPAMEWIRRNLPADGRVLINLTIWNFPTYAGNDGGYWISALGERATFPQPLLYGLTNDRKMIDRTARIGKKILDAGSDPSTLFELMKEVGTNYIYLGGRGGGYSARALRYSPLFNLRYQKDGVWLFERIQSP
jgi:hypothetical protein